MTDIVVVAVVAVAAAAAAAAAAAVDVAHVNVAKERVADIPIVVFVVAEHSTNKNKK